MSSRWKKLQQNDSKNGIKKKSGMNQVGSEQQDEVQKQLERAI